MKIRRVKGKSTITRISHPSLPNGFMEFAPNQDEFDIEPQYIDAIVGWENFELVKVSPGEISKPTGK